MITLWYLMFVYQSVHDAHFLCLDVLCYSIHYGPDLLTACTNTNPNFELKNDCQDLLKTCSETLSENNESKVTCGQVWWPILRICALHLTHPSEHTHTHTHTHREHTPGAVGSQCFIWSGHSWRFGALLKGLNNMLLCSTLVLSPQSTIKVSQNFTI